MWVQMLMDSTTKEHNEVMLNVYKCYSQGGNQTNEYVASLFPGVVENQRAQYWHNGWCYTNMAPGTYALFASFWVSGFSQSNYYHHLILTNSRIPFQSFPVSASAWSVLLARMDYSSCERAPNNSHATHCFQKENKSTATTEYYVFQNNVFQYNQTDLTKVQYYLMGK